MCNQMHRDLTSYSYPRWSSIIIREPSQPLKESFYDELESIVYYNVYKRATQKKYESALELYHTNPTYSPTTEGIIRLMRRVKQFLKETTS